MKELWEFVLFIKLFVFTKMEIPKNTLERIIRIESDLAYTKILGSCPNTFYGPEAYGTH